MSRPIAGDGTNRLSTPAAFAAHFVSEFVLEWMPVLRPRNALNYAALAIPIIAALCACAGILLAVRRIADGKAGPLDIVVASAAPKPAASASSKQANALAVTGSSACSEAAN